MLGAFLLFSYLVVSIIARIDKVLEEADIYTSDT
jgi:hypothetical protein